MKSITVLAAAGVLAVTPAIGAWAAFGASDDNSSRDHAHVRVDDRTRTARHGEPEPGDDHGRQREGRLRHQRADDGAGHLRHGVDDPAGHVRHGGEAEPGDDHGGHGEAESGDDRGTEPGDDHGGHGEAESGDDHGGHRGTEPGDDHGGHSGGDDAGGH